MKYPTLRTIQCLALLGSTGLCLSVLAQDEQSLETTAPATTAVAAPTGTNQVAVAQPSQPITFIGGWAHQFNTHVDNGGNFSVDRFRVGMNLPVDINDQFSLAAIARYQVDAYNFGGGLNPWENIETLTLAGLLKYRPDDRWTIYGGPLMRSSAESGANWGNATRGGGALAASYVVDDTLTVGAGIIAMAQLEDNAMVLPIVTVNWKFADGWRFKVGFTDLTTAGYGAEVAWDIAPDWQLTFGSAFHKSRFRLDDKGANPNGIGQEKSMTTSAAATWSPNQHFSATAFFGLAAGGKIRTENSGGSELGEESYDTVPFAGLSAKVAF